MRIIFFRSLIDEISNNVYYALDTIFVNCALLVGIFNICYML